MWDCLFKEISWHPYVEDQLACESSNQVGIECLQTQTSWTATSVQSLSLSKAIFWVQCKQKDGSSRSSSPRWAATHLARWFPKAPWHLASSRNSEKERGRLELGMLVLRANTSLRNSHAFPQNRSFCRFPAPTEQVLSGRIGKRFLEANQQKRREKLAKEEKGNWTLPNLHASLHR